MPKKCLKCYEPFIPEFTIAPNKLMADFYALGATVPSSLTPPLPEYYHPKCCQALFKSQTSPILDFGVNDIEKLALQTINKKFAITGAQRKLSLAAIHHTSSPLRLTFIGFKEDFILKPPTPDFPEMPELEDLSMSLADICGFDVATHGLIRMQDKSLAYITKRFDRTPAGKVACEDMCQLSLQMSEEKYRGSYELIAKIINKYSSNPGADLVVLLENIIFSFLIGNADLHLKNLSMLRKKNKQIGLSPSYDLLATRLLLPETMDSEELALSLNGKKSKIKLQDFKNFSERVCIPHKVFIKTIERLTNKKNSLLEQIEKSFLSNKKKEEFIKLISRRIERLQQNS